MKKHEILSPQARASLFDPPTDPAAIVRHYTFSPEDMTLIRQRRRAANRLGFAVLLAYLRFPGRTLRPEEAPPAEMLAFISVQTGCKPDEFVFYARREETRWEHLGALQTYLNARPFRPEDRRAVVQAGIEEGAGSDRGDAIVAAMISHLRQRNIWLPASSELERLALAARAIARRRAYRGLAEGLPPATITGLELLLIVAEGEERTSFAWLRDWPEAPRQKNLLAVVERLEAVRKLGVGSDREKRIHRARYAAIAKEIAIFVPRDITRFDAPRRLATLVVFAREMEAALTDAALAMFDKMLGAVFRRADRAHKDNMFDRAKALDASARALLGMAKAMLDAKANNEDQVAAVERALGWERLKALVAATEIAVIDVKPKPDEPEPKRL